MTERKEEFQRPKERGGIYPGWIVLAGCFLSAMLIIGGSLYIYQLFVLPVTAELGITRGEASYAYIAMLLGIAIWSPILGRLYDHVSVKWLMPIGGLAFATGMTTISVLASPKLMLAAIFFCLGPAMVLAGGLAVNTVTTRWFERRRGRALGIAAVSSSAGGFLMTPVTAYLIESFGWRFALSSIGIAIGIIIVLVGLLVAKDRPSEAQLKVYSENLASPDADDGAGAEWTFGKLLASLDFWLVTAGIGLLLASDQAILTTQNPFLVDIGFSTAQAVSVVTAMTGSAILGKLIVGFLAERYDIRFLYILVAIFHILLLAIFIIQPGYVAMLIFASIFGAAVGGIYPVWSVLCSRVFGAKNFGLAFGAMALFSQFLAMGFVGYINNSYDKTSDYSTAFSVFIGAVMLGIVAIIALRLKKAEI